MDDILMAVFEFFAELLEAALELIRNPRKRAWAKTIFYSVLTAALTGFMVWSAFALLKEGNIVGANVFGCAAALLFVFFGALIVWKHCRGWKTGL